jgi:hypothetical protein
MMRRPENSLVLGIALAAAAAVFLGSALVRAVTVAPPPAPLPDDGAALDAAVATLPTPAGDAGPAARVPVDEADAASAPPITQPPELALSMDALRLAVDADPFQPERKRHPDRYLLPGERVTDEPPPEPPPVPPFRIVGTAVSPAGNLALIQVEDLPPRVLAVGESLLGYVLERVDGEFATMTGPQRSVTLPVTKMVLANAEEGRGRAGRGRGAQTQRGNAQGRQLDEARARQQEIMELLREQIRQRGGDVGEMRIQFDGRGRGGGEDVFFFESGVDFGTGRAGGRTIVRGSTIRIDTLHTPN